MSKYNYGIAIHGGAGTITRSKLTPEKERAYTEALTIARDTGYEVLKAGGSSLEAVEKAVIELEDCPLFNAGRGSVFNAHGEHEMDASIMEGNQLAAGAVAAVKSVKNPISLAVKVLHHSDHILLIGSGALEFAQDFEIEMKDADYFHDDFRYAQWQKIKNTNTFQLDHAKDHKPYLGTVGAVALDQFGNLAAATSTGGMTNKKFGRVGDSPIIGAGTFAKNSTCAISCTGSGEYLMRGVTAYDISCLMEYKELSLENAAHEAIMNRLTQLGGDGGIIGIDQSGNITMPFNCDGMYRASRNQSEAIVAIY